MTRTSAELGYGLWTTDVLGSLAYRIRVGDVENVLYYDMVELS